MDALDKSSQMADAVVKLAKIPGFSRMAKHLDDKANKVFELCYKFAEYGFNKSHSAAYALVSYQTAYFKANYTLEYMTCLLTSVQGSLDKTVQYVSECGDLGIQILPPVRRTSCAWPWWWLPFAF